MSPPVRLLKTVRLLETLEQLINRHVMNQFLVTYLKQNINLCRRFNNASFAPFKQHTYIYRHTLTNPIVRCDFSLSLGTRKTFTEDASFVKGSRPSFQGRLKLWSEDNHEYFPYLSNSVESHGWSANNCKSGNCSFLHVSILSILNTDRFNNLNPECIITLK